jgi:hypothetical protein
MQLHMKTAGCPAGGPGAMTALRGARIVQGQMIEEAGL